MSKIESSAYEATDQLTASGVAAGADFLIANQSGDDKKMTITKLATFMNTNLGAISATSFTGTTVSATNVNIANDTTVTDAGNFVLGTSTGTQFGTTSSQKIAFYGATPVNKGTALTAADAVALDATYNATEQTTVSNMRVRINEMEVILQDLGLVN